ncbi:translation initiation factor IF-2-like [Vulpes lagopus]|uniref:translation initiation factor IF-2-like n=1 Tax=Vulpes lagopus TaxID=494514 RepID=UPI001BCA30F8|nr:translation initiation factor IF-2-like [Vulpes lagopus]
MPGSRGPRGGGRGQRVHARRERPAGEGAPRAGGGQVPRVGGAAAGGRRARVRAGCTAGAGAGRGCRARAQGSAPRVSAASLRPPPSAPACPQHRPRGCAAPAASRRLALRPPGPYSVFILFAGKKVSATPREAGGGATAGARARPGREKGRSLAPGAGPGIRGGAWAGLRAGAGPGARGGAEPGAWRGVAGLQPAPADTRGPQPGGGGGDVSRRAGHVAALREPQGLTDASDVWRCVAQCPWHPLDARPLCPAHSGLGEPPRPLLGPERGLSPPRSSALVAPTLAAQPLQLSPRSSALAAQPSKLSPCSSALAAQPLQLSPRSSALAAQPSKLSPCSSALAAQPLQLSPRSSALAAQPLQLSPCSSALAVPALAAQPSQLSPCSSALAAQPLQRPPCDLGTPCGPGAERAFRGPGHEAVCPVPAADHPSVTFPPCPPPQDPLRRSCLAAASLGVQDTKEAQDTRC